MTAGATQNAVLRQTLRNYDAVQVPPHPLKVTYPPDEVFGFFAYQQQLHPAKRFIREIKIWSPLTNEHVVQFYGFILNSGSGNVKPTPGLGVIPARGGRGLSDYLNPKQTMTDDEHLTMPTKMATHNCGILEEPVFHDLNPRRRQWRPCGWYAAPELLKGGSSCSRQSDVWAFGSDELTLADIFRGKRPFHYHQGATITLRIYPSICRPGVPYQDSQNPSEEIPPFLELLDQELEQPTGRWASTCQYTSPTFCAYRDALSGELKNFFAQLEAWRELQTVAHLLSKIAKAGDLTSVLSKRTEGKITAFKPSAMRLEESYQEGNDGQSCRSTNEGWMSGPIPDDLGIRKGISEEVSEGGSRYVGISVAKMAITTIILTQTCCPPVHSSPMVFSDVYSVIIGGPFKSRLTRCWQSLGPFTHDEGKD
ncbi:uncharacterized protein EI90DRAFT_3016949 [Cantharellus anzutake]|uniref:uncharacterized protein n=1 Tax=Cantharellus anzutake TaxID=1750568 RepID=UPI00190431C0|nr:uncharacterized protein EI90DRAFT_3016949 [Cantharellus anzutake]KAF8330002.1 hypothetical protein EI90DRAFT_3016949 [Cantharellus anzutake]